MVITGFLACAMERRRALEREAAGLIALHGDHAGLIAGHLATHPELSVDTCKGWGRLARAMERRLGHSWRFDRPA